MNRTFKFREIERDREGCLWLCAREKKRELQIRECRAIEKKHDTREVDIGFTLSPKCYECLHQQIRESTLPRDWQKLRFLISIICINSITPMRT